MRVLARILLVVLGSVLFAAPLAHAAPPRIALWDPQFGTDESRFQLDRPAVEAMAQSLQHGGVEATRLTAEQLADPAQFNARRFDGVIVLGSAVPRMDIEAFKRFADAGGVLMNLDALVPFIIAIEPVDGQWRLSPREPKFAWQSTELLEYLGLRYIYKTELHDQGVFHTVTPLLRRYVPDASDKKGARPSRWIVPQAGGSAQIFPLLRSQRRDGADVPAQLYLVRNSARRAIFSTSADYTAPAPNDQWEHGAQTLVGLARLARDLHDGTLKLDDTQAVTIAADMAPLPRRPLDRVATASVEPEGAIPIVRWGRFDGSNLELDGKDPAQPPGVLSPHSSVRLALPPLEKGPLYLRVRGAYDASGAALKVEVGSRVVINESFVYIDTSGVSNFSRSLAGRPTEFTRIVFLPLDADARQLTLSNPGRAPLYLDAMQIERRTGAAPARIIGLGSGVENRYSPDLSAGWSGMRTSLRTNLIGPPDDPKRFDKVDQLLNRLRERNAHLEPILEGTPPWAAISEPRLHEAEQAKRPSTVPPDPAKYAKLTEAIIQRYGDSFDTYEIWNEADIDQYYRGSEEEYIELFKTIVPVIRRLDPTAKVMTTGMSGFHETFLRKLWRAGVLDEADLVAFHPYAGKSPGWDTPYGLLQGALMSWGVDREIFCNESGFPFVNAEWFQPPPVLTPQKQAQMLSVAMARLLATGIPKVSVFNAGGDNNAYGLIDARGVPRPAYAVFADYAHLGQSGATRLDVGLTGAEGDPIEGIYVAGSLNPDHSVVMVVNPADNQTLSPPPPPDTVLTASARWTTFFGTAQFARNQATITPAGGKAYAGFYKTFHVDVDRFPILQVQATGEQADWEMLLKRPDGTALTVVPRRGGGTVRLNYRDLLKTGGRQELELSFRLYAPTTLASVRLVPEADRPRPEPAPIPVRLCVPLPNAAAFRVIATAAGVPVEDVHLTQHAGLGGAWAELVLPLRTRTLVRLQPAGD